MSMNVSCSTDGSDFDPSGIVKSIHSIPHVDIDLNRSPSQFDLSPEYFEAIIIWGAVPVLVCICLYILMTVYHICVCCCCCCRAEKKTRPKAVNCGCAFLISLLVVFTLGLIGASLYAEFVLNENILSFVDQGDNIDKQVVNATDTIVNSYNSTVVDEALDDIVMGLSNTTAEQDALALKMEADSINTALSNIVSPLDTLNLSSTLNNLEYYEEIRHWSVVGYLVFLAVILLVVFVVLFCLTAAGNTTMLIIVGVVSISVWIVTGAMLAYLIVLSDVCDDPDTALRNIVNGTEAAGVVDYYIVCKEVCDPFAQERNLADMAIENAEVLQTSLLEYIMENVTDSDDLESKLKSVSDATVSISSAVRAIEVRLTCTTSQGIHEYYMGALDHACNNGFLFSLILFALFVSVAVCLFVLMCCMSCFVGLLVSTLNDEEDPEEYTSYDVPRTSTWSQRRSSYSEPYSNGNNGYNNPEEYRLTGLSRNATIETPKYTEGRPTSGEYDHFDT